MNRILKSAVAGVSFAALAGFAVPASAQVNLYWDINGTAPGAGGPDVSGTWDAATANWNTDPTGGDAGALSGWTDNANNAIFSAGLDAVTLNLTLPASVTANNVTIRNGVVTLGANAINSTGVFSVVNGATFSINSTLRLGGTGPVLLDNGTIQQTNPSNAGSFIPAGKELRIGAGGGRVEYTTNGLTSIYGSTTGTGGTIVRDASVGVGQFATLIKSGVNSEFRYQGTGLPNTTYDKLVVEGGLFRLGFAASTQSEVGFGAVPASFMADQITLRNGGAIGASFIVNLNANRGITLDNGGLINVGGAAMTIPGAISGNGTLRVVGTQGATLTGVNTFDGKLQIGSDFTTFVVGIGVATPTVTTPNIGGVVRINGDTALGAVPASFVADAIGLGGPTAAGTLNIDTSTTIHENRGITLGGTTATINVFADQTVTYNGVMTGAAAFTKTGAGKLILGGSNTNTGTVTSFGGGVLSIGTDPSLGAVPGAPVANAITLAGATTGGTLEITANGTIAANRGVTLNNGGADPVVGVGGTISVPAGVTASVAGVITGTGRFNKAGDGTLALTGVNTYTGQTTVAAGTLQVNAAHDNAASYTVAAGGTLGGTGPITFASGSSLAVNGGTISPGSATGTLTINGDATLNAGSALKIEVASAANFDSFVVSGTTTLTDSTLQVDMLGGYNPLPADSFTVATAGSLSGTFTNLNAWGLITVLGGGKAFLPQYSATNLVLTDYARVGDVNRDGAVNNLDIASFVGLLTGSPAAGSVGFAGDVNGDGVVNNLDIAPFVALLTGGRPVGDDPEFAPLLALVPEPASLSLLALGGLMLGRRRRNV